MVPNSVLHASTIITREKVAPAQRRTPSFYIPICFKAIQNDPQKDPPPQKKIFRLFSGTKKCILYDGNFVNLWNVPSWFLSRWENASLSFISCCVMYCTNSAKSISRFAFWSAFCMISCNRILQRYALPTQGCVAAQHSAKQGS